MKKVGNYSTPRLLAWLAASLMAMLVAGCGGGGSGGVGTLGVSLTDAPSCGFDAVNVTVVKVRVHQSRSASVNDAGWTDIALNPSRKINLLNLTNGVLDNLGEASLSAGHYTQLQLVLDPNTSGGLANSVVPTGGTETALITPSAVQSGIKLINEFDVVSGQRVDLVMDFNACKSIVKHGNGTYSLKPVIKILPFALNGIDGFIDTTLLGSGVTITAQQSGTVVQSTIPNAQTGEFLLSRLAPGNYDVVLTANAHATAVITTVPVISTTSVVNVSDILTPITLPVSAAHIVSGTATLSPTSSTEIAYVAAKQTFGTAPAVTVQFVAADDSASGAYTLTLPVGAPMLGQYTTGTLPIALAAQSAMAGKYAIEATATGYQPQQVDADISAADATQNLILIP
ncbi:MAG: DUF4382 domain-containing protein [Nitrosomonadales bacterium]|nr:DUF4382 domain-containing protein [Nitrosomonadales bacterium]